MTLIEQAFAQIQALVNEGRHQEAEEKAQIVSDALDDTGDPGELEAWIERIAVLGIK